ncbi:MAG: hypothetical protein ACK5JH_05835 [Anaerocolumna sp.]
MKIAFWSSTKGNAGVTSNMACISIVAALGYSYKAILLENHYQTNNIGHLIKYHHGNLLQTVNTNHMNALGMNHIMRSLSIGNFFLSSKQSNYDNDSDDPYSINHSKTESWLLNDSNCKYKRKEKDTIDIIKEATLEIIDNYLYYLPTSTMVPSNVYDFAMLDYVKNILDAAQELADIIYIDTSKDNYLSTKIILEDVDLVVVNLNQTINEFKYFFQNYASLTNKCVFLISKYQAKSELSIHKLSNLFSIPKSRIEGIPYDEDYQEALNRGSLVEFLSSNFDCSYYDPIYTFIDGIEKAVTMILMEGFQRKKGGWNEAKA